MNHVIKYLPGFDACHIESFFSNDSKVIEEIFLLTNCTIRDDVYAVQHSFEANDLYSVREAIHKIKPVFNIIGLLNLEQEVGKFYHLSLKAASVEDIRIEYAQLLPRLHDAWLLIAEQTKLFHRAVEEPGNHEMLTQPG